MLKLYDDVLGNLIYNGGWSKNENVIFWDRDISIKIIVSAYEYEKVNLHQRESYTWFKKEIINISKKSYLLMKGYINEQEEDIKLNLNLQSIPNDILSIVQPKTVLIQDDGRIGILCDVEWDSHGVAIIIDKNIEVGPQDLIW